MQTPIFLALAATVVALTGCASTSSTTPDGARKETCKPTSEKEIAALFDRWNNSLQTGDPHKVVENYAERSILLSALSNQPRLTAAEKEEYFRAFLKTKPMGRIDSRFIEIDCNTAVDAGFYTFTFASTGIQAKARYTFTYKWDGMQWLITSQHSSGMPGKD